MTKIYVYTNDGRKVRLDYLRPRNYMMRWSFGRLLKYVSSELEWEEINENDVEIISFINDEEHWFYNVRKENQEA